MTLDLDALEALEKKATKAGWRLFDSGLIVEISPPTGQLGESPSVVGWSGFDQSDMPFRKRRTNANLIVEARNALPELIRLARIGQRVERDTKENG